MRGCGLGLPGGERLPWQRSCVGAPPLLAAGGWTGAQRLGCRAASRVPLGPALPLRQDEIARLRGGGAAMEVDRGAAAGAGARGGGGGGAQARRAHNVVESEEEEEGGEGSSEVPQSPAREDSY